MIRNKNTAWFFVASLAANILLTVVRGRQFSFAEIIGGTLGLILVPFLFAYLAKWISQLVKINFDDLKFKIIYFVGWVFLVTANLLA